VKMNLNAYLIFIVNDQFYGISVVVVKQIIRSVQPVFLAEAPELLFGVIDMGGETIPVINIHKQFKLPIRDISLSDRIIITQTPYGCIAFIADHIEGIVELASSDITPSEKIFPKLEHYIIGTAKYGHHSLLIYDINKLFPEAEIEHITRFLKDNTKSA